MHPPGNWLPHTGGKEAWHGRIARRQSHVLEIAWRPREGEMVRTLTAPGHLNHNKHLIIKDKSDQPMGKGGGKRPAHEPQVLQKAQDRFQERLAKGRSSRDSSAEP